MPRWSPPTCGSASHTDLAALREFAKGCDAVTFDHEHVPTEHIEALEAEGVKIFPGVEALVFAQDKRRDAGTARPRWARRCRAGGRSPRPTDIDEPSRRRLGWPVVAKATRGGYDGRGVWMLAVAPPRPPSWWRPAPPLIVEERVPLRRELAALVARSPFGQVAAYPVVETVQRDGICVEVLAPAPGLSEDAGAWRRSSSPSTWPTRSAWSACSPSSCSRPTPGIVVNELAMRPHNSGHWTIEGARTSQFEQHLRAVLDYPMGDDRR